MRLDLDRRLKLENHGSKVNSDAELLPCRELDDVVGLTEIAGGVSMHTRRRKNCRHGLVGQFGAVAKPYCFSPTMCARLSVPGNRNSYGHRLVLPSRADVLAVR